MGARQYQKIMSPRQLLRLFPNASQSVLAANGIDYGSGQPDEGQAVDSRRSTVKPEPNRLQRLEGVLPGQEKVGGRIVVRITVRKCGRQQDPDNAVWKSLVDQLRACRVIPEDDGETIKLETDQIRVRTKKEEGTEVVIIYP